MGLRYDEINEILKLIDNSSCDEFVLETEDIKLVVRRRGANNHSVAATGADTLFVGKPKSAPQAPAPQAPALRAKAQATSNVVLAPMVGTFYRSPSPGEPPFVEVGSKVNKGDPICIIEVMKLFTTISAEWSGTVKEIGAENGALVEYGQMLFVIGPD
ncbi:MAG TPA: acetyl-CoA carboxylase biotin carboxyl carrier protein [Hyphomicrobiaceae bacterium]|jgi:acetyl-CoA carboxylase biotin carboxyl carrier protein|nr:acetyl-CoA carboxylase biotin carboxyl carrier protein [Hyphomicrobiaceae bacterium]